MPTSKSAAPYDPVSGPLRAVIAKRKLTAYGIARDSGVDVAAVTRFIAGKGLTLASVDRIARALGLRLIESGRPPATTARRPRPTTRPPGTAMD